MGRRSPLGLRAARVQEAEYESNPSFAIGSLWGCAGSRRGCLAGPDIPGPAAGGPPPVCHVLCRGGGGGLVWRTRAVVSDRHPGCSGGALLLHCTARLVQSFAPLSLGRSDVLPVRQWHHCPL